jgi:predicted transcriptional regulator of viral defense system
LRAAGLSRNEIEGRLSSGRLLCVHRGVYAVGHRLLGARARWLAAVLACGDGAVLSHRSAAMLWGLRPSAPVTPEVTIPSRNGRRQREGLVIHRATNLPQAEVTHREGIPVTTPARTLLDLAAVVGRHDVERAMEAAERLRLFDLGALREVLTRHGGRAGTPLVAAVLEQYAEPEFTRSELERVFLELCAAHGLPPPAVNVWVADYEVDFFWRAQNLIAEADSRRFHATRAAFERDRARDARLTALGYRVVRFTYRQVEREPTSVAGVLGSLLAQPERSISSTR